MPIKPENRARYPKDWKAIRDAIVARAEAETAADRDQLKAILAEALLR